MYRISFPFLKKYTPGSSGIVVGYHMLTYFPLKGNVFLGFPIMFTMTRPELIFLALLVSVAFNSVFFYFIIHCITRGSRKRATWRGGPVVNVPCCQNRRKIRATHNSKLVLWQCVTCKKVFPTDSQNGLERNMNNSKRSTMGASH